MKNVVRGRKKRKEGGEIEFLWDLLLRWLLKWPYATTTYWLLLAPGLIHLPPIISERGIDEEKVPLALLFRNIECKREREREVPCHTNLPTKITKYTRSRRRFSFYSNCALTRAAVNLIVSHSILLF